MAHGRHVQDPVVLVYNKELENVMTSNKSLFFLMLSRLIIEIIMKYLCKSFNKGTEVPDYYCGGNAIEYKTCNLNVSKAGAA